ncbi:S-layer family protein [Nostoc sp. ChiQUE01b]|uniref:S-layer family protein n=1 Tax=Nostoc sp. ChiQUE01b TaxID=3075376 RepID=UPI002AD2AE54|nr:S-layer family protein [Nostoc sp. ChiQUE01b]MDZ8260530.1 S-layer family protein [Nostoc sp. ChiQUE01b]
MRVLTFLLVLTSGLITPGMMRAGIAQVTSDATTNTIVNQNGNNFTITNGSRVGNNLFHSFSQFSIPTNGSASFNNASDIQNIFSRVTGGNVSHIDGLIQANGSANLFLLNPKGIIFGQNASLNIGGSFIATTAESIKFADGAEFKAISSQAPPLLSINVPIGLQLGSNPGALALQGTGHTLTLKDSRTPINRTPSPTQLRVQPGKTLALVGGTLNLHGATLTAEQGRIELGSLGDAGLVSLVPTTQGYTLGYGNGQNFSDIQLQKKSLLDVSGVNAGSVQVQGKHIQLTDSSLVLAQNLGNLPGGNLHLQASAGIDVTGTLSGIRSETLGIGTSGNISVITPRFSLQQGAALNNITFGTATSGNVQVDASVLEISGFSPISSTGSVINTSTFSSGSAGNVFVNGDSLLVSDGAGLSSISRGSGDSGQVVIHNMDTTVRGSNSAPMGTRISSTAFSTGNAKTITLDTGRLHLLDGGAITTSSFSAGHGGDIRINATESIQIIGSKNVINNSGISNSSITSSVLSLSPTLQKRFNVFYGTPVGDAGTVSITTPNLTLQDGGAVSVTNDGSGNGGSINLAADSIELKNQALIQAKTTSGDGGNISLGVGKLLQLRDNSQITATAGGNGNGGNVNINSPIIVGLENSDIVANAVQGSGGNINITTQGIFGLEYRPQLTPENDITASSQFGVNGTVDINNFGVDPSSGLVELPVNLVDSSQQIATGCSNNTGSSFVATGRGGVPQNPTQEVRSDVYDGLRLRTWSDVRNLSAFGKTGAATAQIPSSTEVIVQATSWHRNANGQIELVAQTSLTQVQPALTCAAIPQS